MGGMKEVWEKGKLPMMTDNKNIVASMEKIKKNKAKAISAELLELNLKNKLEETGKTR